MEAIEVLAGRMQSRGRVRNGTEEAGAGRMVRQRIDPHIHDVPGAARNSHNPVLCRIVTSDHRYTLNPNVKPPEQACPRWVTEHPFRHLYTYETADVPPRCSMGS